jgi:hypothetical protein
MACATIMSIVKNNSQDQVIKSSNDDQHRHGIELVDIYYHETHAHVSILCRQTSCAICK